MESLFLVGIWAEEQGEAEKKKIKGIVEEVEDTSSLLLCFGLKLRLVYMGFTVLSLSGIDCCPVFVVFISVFSPISVVTLY